MQPRLAHINHRGRRLLSDRDDEVREIDPDVTVASANSYTWTHRALYSFEVTAYVIQAFLKKACDDWLEINVLGRSEFEFGVKNHTSIISRGTVAFSYQGHVYCYMVTCQECTQTISANGSVEPLVRLLKEEIKTNNPLRRKHIQVANDAQDFRALLRPTPSATFESLILDSKMKEDIYDNTIFQLKHLSHSNGLIFHGEPGTGKSLMCQAIVHEAIKEGFSTCYLIGHTNFTALNEFIEKFLTPCIIVFEDIDAFARSREEKENAYFSDFLQFLSGLSVRDDPLVVIATTNHLHLLDKAINNRPVRFNRKYNFKLPSNSQIDRLIDLYFPDMVVSQEIKRRCHDKEFTGSHISEIKRTALTLAKKHAKPLIEVFPDAVQIVQEQFSPTLNPIGFCNSNGD